MRGSLNAAVYRTLQLEAYAFSRIVKSCGTKQSGGQLDWRGVFTKVTRPG
jgi:hypothetical protein